MTCTLLRRLASRLVLVLAIRLPASGLVGGGGAAIFGGAGPVIADDSIELVETRKIRDRAPHNAFTDLVRFRDQWFCVFREGEGHESRTTSCYCVLRRECKPATGLLGVSQPPYTTLEWKDLGRRIGGPHMLRLPDGRSLAAVRLYDGKVRTSLCWLDPKAGKLTEAVALPSGGDTSYAGLVRHEDTVWISSYSSHEGKASICLAKAKVGGQSAMAGGGHP